MAEIHRCIHDHCIPLRGMQPWYCAGTLNRPVTQNVCCATSSFYQKVKCKKKEGKVVVLQRKLCARLLAGI